MTDEVERDTGAQEMKTGIKERELNRREQDTALQKEVNQNVQTGTNDTTHRGIKWGASYKTKKKNRNTRSNKEDEGFRVEALTP